MNKNFNELGISPPILKAIEDMGFNQPTEVQTRAIPTILKQNDIIVMSKTGSGKTAVFGVPILQLTDPDAPGPQALILTPTRELAVQVDSDIKQMSKYLQHKTTAVYGQHSMNTELQAIKRGATIVTGTPGRVYDHISNRNMITRNIRFLVLDEADRMLDMGFLDQVVRIIKSIPENRVTLLFSATIPSEIHRICTRYMKNPVSIEIESDTKTVDKIKQVYYRVEHNEKRTQLNRLLLIEQPESCLIFCNTKISVDRVQSFLSRKGYASLALHGDIPQVKRMKTIQQFKEGNFHLLVATDVAARGLHIEDLSLVINYDVPLEKDSYVHRIGRTGRAGHGGLAMTLVTGDDIMSLYEIEEHIGALIEEKELPSETDFQAGKAKAEKWLQSNREKSTLSRASYGKIAMSKTRQKSSLSQGSSKVQKSDRRSSYKLSETVKSANRPKPVHNTKPSQRTAETVHKAPQKAPEKVLSKAPQKTLSKAPQKTLSKAPQKTLSKAPQKALSKAPQKTVPKAPRGNRIPATAVLTKSTRKKPIKPVTTQYNKTPGGKTRTSAKTSPSKKTFLQRVLMKISGDKK